MAICYFFKNLTHIKINSRRHKSKENEEMNGLQTPLGALL